MFAIARLKPSVSLDQARIEMRGVAERIAQVNPENEGNSASVERLEDVVLGDVRPTLRLLLAAVLLVLVIACANVVNLAVRAGRSALS